MTTQLDRIRESKGGKVLAEVLKNIAANPEKTLNVALNAGLAYQGYKELPELMPIWMRLVWGPVALKLATTPASGGEISLGIGGFSFPVNSQVAGLTMLATLGLASVPWQGIGEALETQAREEKEVIAWLIALQDVPEVSPETKEKLNAALLVILHRSKPREQAIAEAWALIEEARKELPTPDPTKLVGPMMQCQICGAEFFTSAEMEQHNAMYH